MGRLLLWTARPLTFAEQRHLQHGFHSTIVSYPVLGAKAQTYTVVTTKHDPAREDIIKLVEWLVACRASRSRPAWQPGDIASTVIHTDEELQKRGIPVR